MNALDIYRRAGFPKKHGQAFQEIADESDRIIISRCAQEVGIGLLEENYASKGFGIKAKSCDWGPFAGFAMGHFQYSKFPVAASYQKQIDFFESSTHTGFENKETHVHIELAKPDILRVTANRLKFLRNLKKIDLIPGVENNALVRCRGPFGTVVFKLVYVPGPSDAEWAFLHRNKPSKDLEKMARDNQGKPGVDPESEWNKWTLVKGMVNTLPEDRNMSDPAKNCVAGDYDLWTVFPRRGSSMAMHGMDRQVRIFAGVNPNASQGIRDKVKALQKDATSRAPVRTYSKMHQGKLEEFSYQEDPELGNVSPLVMDTMHKLNRRIKDKGYRGGRMVHHNDDMGNPYRNDVEKDLIAFVPGRGVYFIDDGSYYKFIKEYETDYAVYDNWAIWGQRA